MLGAMGSSVYPQPIIISSAIPLHKRRKQEGEGRRTHEILADSSTWSDPARFA